MRAAMRAGSWSGRSMRRMAGLGSACRVGGLRAIILRCREGGREGGMGVFLLFFSWSLVRGDSALVERSV